MKLADKIREIATRLLEKSRSNEVNWQKGDDYPRLWFVVRFEKSHLELRYYAPSADPDVIALSLHNEDGTEVGKLTADEDPENADWKLLEGLWREAERLATGWDKVIEDVERGINAKGPIGLPS